MSTLIHAIKDKLHNENHIPNNDQTKVIITSGANQAYMNCVLTLLSEKSNNKNNNHVEEEDDDEEEGIQDVCVVFKPYYFNHVMAVQMTRGDDALLIGPIDEQGIPDIQWLRQTLYEQQQEHQKLFNHQTQRCKTRIKMVTITNPGNPTGVSLSTSQLQQFVDLCKEYNVWLVMDNTYEHFDHDQVNCFPIPSSTNHNTEKEEEVIEQYGYHCFDDEHVINIFSFSKGYAMAGFRVGYVVINAKGNKGNDAYEQMMKVQDTIPICTSRLSQIAALGALTAGRQWVIEKVRTLDASRDAILKALAPLETIIGGNGAMYVMAKLPLSHSNDRIIGEMFVEKYGIAIIPGSFCGYPGWIRVCYSNLKPSDCIMAAERLSNAVKDLCNTKE